MIGVLFDFPSLHIMVKVNDMGDQEFRRKYPRFSTHNGG